MIEVAVNPARLIVGRIATIRVQLTNISTRPCTRVRLCLKLPAQIVLLDASAEIDIPRLGPSEGVTRNLRVKARTPGTFHISSSAFSYRDSFGAAVHPESVSAALEVLPEQPSLETPLPAIIMGLATAELPLESWALLEGWIENTGDIPVRDVELR